MQPKRAVFLLVSLIVTALLLGVIVSRLKPVTPVPAPRFRATCTPKELEKLYSTAVFVPHVADALTVGFVLTKIEPESPWARWGLLPKDVVKTVSGQPVTDAQAFLGAVGSLCEKGVRVEYSRAGVMRSFTTD